MYFDTCLLVCLYVSNKPKQPEPKLYLADFTDFDSNIWWKNLYLVLALIPRRLCQPVCMTEGCRGQTWRRLCSCGPGAGRPGAGWPGRGCPWPEHCSPSRAASAPPSPAVRRCRARPGTGPGRGARPGRGGNSRAPEAARSSPPAQASLPTRHVHTFLRGQSCIVCCPHYSKGPFKTIDNNPFLGSLRPLVPCRNTQQPRTLQ